MKTLLKKHELRQAYGRTPVNSLTKVPTTVKIKAMEPKTNNVIRWTFTVLLTVLGYFEILSSMREANLVDEKLAVLGLASFLLALVVKP